MADFPVSLHLVEASPEAQPELVLDHVTACDYDRPKQAYRSVSNPAIDWERLARVRTHPTQVGILELLSMDDGRVLSPNEMAFELQVELGSCSYHVTELEKAGLLELVDTQPRRGALEHYYRVIP